MSETATILPRRFINESMVLTDPDPEATAEEVMALYAEHYPQLITAHVTGPVLKDDAIEYTFVTKYGTKGAEEKADFGLMADVASVLCNGRSEDQHEAAPTEIVEAVC